MKIQALHENFQMPTRNSTHAGGYDIYMPLPGRAYGIAQQVPLGFAAEVPDGHIALLLPRSGVGSKHGVELNNTCGVIDSDYRGEWIATLRTKHNLDYYYSKGDRLLQFVIVPVICPVLELVESLSVTERADGGLGSTGN